LIVAMLLLAAPVMATTTISVVVNTAEKFTAADGNKVQPVSITYSTDVNVRAFALDINIDSNNGAPNFQYIRNFKVGESNAVSPGYGIFPSRFRDFVTVAPPNWNNEANYNPTVAWNEPEQSGTGMGYPKMIVEMGTLYAGDANKPAWSGTLFKFDVNAWGSVGTFCITVQANALRGGVVGNDGNAIAATFVGNCVTFAPDCVTPSNQVDQTVANACSAWVGQGLTCGTGTGVVNCAKVGLVLSHDTACVALGTPVNYTYGIQATVPNVVGQPEATATANITAAGLPVGTMTSGHSCTVTPGSVTSTNPVSGTVTCVAVDYNVATACTVPNIVGMTKANADAALLPAGFTSTPSYDWSASVPKGTVISQNPAAGTQPGCCTAVAYVVSQGPTPVACFDPCGTTFSAQKTQYNGYITNKWDPNCWCEYPTGSGFQCHGDADGKATSAPNSYRVFTGDMSLVTGNWQKKAGTYPNGANPCADTDHKTTSAPNSYKVFSGDLARVTSNWQRKGCTSTTGTLIPRNCPLSDAKNIATYVTPTSCADGK